MGDCLYTYKWCCNILYSYVDSTFHNYKETASNKLNWRSGKTEVVFSWHTSIIKSFLLLLFKYLLKYEWICKVLYDSLVQHLQQLVEDVLSEDICTLRALALWHGGQERTFSPWETCWCWFSQSKEIEAKFKSVIPPSISGHSFYVKYFSG